MTQDQKTETEASAVLKRLVDITGDLFFVEGLQKEKVTAISKAEDAGNDPLYVVYNLHQFYSIANCLQFLYCNEEIIRKALTIYDRVLRGEWKVMEREPDEGMITVGVFTILGFGRASNGVCNAYRKMWDAAPSVPEEK